ncbi:transposon Ty3-I Gag-Pol polyprotein [Trichonephila clavata]|uniref:Transposon Ty3-I Gag-Pol polyprotein n=1 Tax=Trichonephila clavata TaxID=2740835 RepID=A0A8X6KST6_TRICU|nr:transposon Ty3-I Gag-Pol polyprotein [Trichonephila clavata]
MLREFKELVPKSTEEFGRTNLTKHRIDTGNHPPIKQHPRRLPFAKVEEKVRKRVFFNRKTTLTEHKRPFVWTEESEVAFTSLKEALTSAPILSYPDPDKQFILDTEANHANVGAVLSQEIDGHERVIAYWSKCLSKPERNYCVTGKELLAIVKAVENFHSYVYGRKFLLRTDHASLTWLLNFKSPEGQIAKWIQKLQEYDFDI